MKLLKRLIYIINHNAGFLLALIIIILGFSIIHFQKDNNKILRDTSATVNNTETILNNQKNDLGTMQNEIASLKRFSACLLALHDAGQFADGDVQQQCEKMSGKVKLDDVTRSPAPNTSQRGNSQPQNTNQGQGNNEPQPPNEPEPGVVQSIIGGIMDTTQVVRDFLNPFN